MAARSSRLCALVLSALAAALAGGCGADHGTGPGGATSIVVTAPDTSVLIGDSVQLTATVMDAAGRAVSGYPIVWTSVDSAVVQVEAATGEVRALTPGPATILATSGGLQGSLTIGAVLPSGVGGVARSLDAAETHSCAVAVDGVLYCWGNGGYHQLGTGSTAPANLPAPVLGGHRFVVVAAEVEHTCGIADNGVTYCWGLNGHGELGVGDTVHRDMPTPVAGGLAFTSIALGMFHTCGLTADGIAYCWGLNGEGAIGDGNNPPNPDRLVPTRVAGDLRFTAITAGVSHTCGLAVSGAAYCWGDGSVGQIGDGSQPGDPSSVPSRTPLPVVGGLRFMSIAAGYWHTCAIAVGGAAYCWGADQYAQQGRGTDYQYPSSTPSPVVGGLRYASVVSGERGSCGLTSEGAAYCWGWNSRGQLGDVGDTATQVTSPVPVAGEHHFAAVSIGLDHACGVTTDGKLYCWGGNDHYELGSSEPTQSAMPLVVPGTFRRP